MHTLLLVVEEVCSFACERGTCVSDQLNDTVIEIESPFRLTEDLATETVFRTSVSGPSFSASSSVKYSLFRNISIL